MSIFKKAIKSKSKLRVMLDGASGSGKTYSALVLAAAFSDKVAVIDTEHGSASLYADKFNFDVVQLKPPYAPENYIEVMKAAQAAQCNNFIYDLESTDREVFVETGGLHGYWPSPKKHNVFCVRNNSKKLIYNDSPQTWEFYDLQNDPLEKNNIFDSDSEEIQYFKDRLLHYLTLPTGK